MVRLDNLEAENKGRTIILSYEGDKFEKNLGVELVY